MELTLTLLQKSKFFTLLPNSSLLGELMILTLNKVKQEQFPIHRIAIDEIVLFIRRLAMTYEDTLPTTFEFESEFNHYLKYFLEEGFDY